MMAALVSFGALKPRNAWPAHSSVVPAQSARAGRLAAGKLLVADEDLPDPRFANTVLLLIEHDAEKGTAGLMLNRRTGVPLSRLLPDLKEARGRSDPVYAGGPVGLNEIFALLRAARQPEQARRIFGDVHLISTRELLGKSLTDRVDPARFRVYAGYAGWAPGQLDREVDLGAWHIFPGDSNAVFDPQPDSLWQRLIQQTHMRMALSKPMHALWRTVLLHLREPLVVTGAGGL